MVLKVKRLHPDAFLPTRGSAKSSGLDLYALEDTWISSEGTRIVKTGVAFGIPDGFEIQVRPRSGLSLKSPLRVANSPGTVDADYTGECCVIMTNISVFSAHFNSDGSGDESGYLIKRGDRIAQAVLVPVAIPDLQEVEDLAETVRGSSGFGSSGI